MIRRAEELSQMKYPLDAQFDLLAHELKSRFKFWLFSDIIDWGSAGEHAFNNRYLWAGKPRSMILHCFILNNSLVVLLYVENRRKWAALPFMQTIYQINFLIFICLSSFCIIPILVATKNMKKPIKVTIITSPIVEMFLFRSTRVFTFIS